MKSIALFFASILESLFNGRVEKEINQRILPHLYQQKDCGYQFGSREEHLQTIQQCKLEVELGLKAIESESARMPRAYGEAFRYIAYRDLNKRLATYRKLAEKRAMRTCPPQFVATATLQ